MSTTSNPNAEFILIREYLNDTIKYPWFLNSYNAYKPSALDHNKIRDEKKHLKFVIYGGSWCEDTHFLLPKMLKTIESAGIKKKSIKIYGVDRDKKTVGNLKDGTAPGTDQKIDRVPTMIVYYDDQEIGRIIESVRKSVENDIVQIIAEAEYGKLKK